MYLSEKLPTIYDVVVHMSQLPLTPGSQKKGRCIDVTENIWEDLVCSDSFLTFTTGNGCYFYFLSV